MKLTNIRAIIMTVAIFLMSMFSLALAGPATMVAQSDVSDALFVADMDGVVIVASIMLAYEVSQPSFVNVEQQVEMNASYGVESTSTIAQVHTDIRNSFAEAIPGVMPVLKVPTYMLVSESRDYKIGKSALSIAYWKPKNLVLDFRNIDN